MYEDNYKKRRAYYERRRKRKRRIILKRTVCFLLLAAAVIGGITAVKKHISSKESASGISKSEVTERLKAIEIPAFVDKQIIHLHNTARTGTPLDGVKNIVIHYVGNPGTSAQNNRDYFDKNSTEVSSHFLVGLDGEIIQCVPLWEKSAASNWRNNDTISIEVCHPDESGKFGDETYKSVVKLTAWLLSETGLDENAVIRHYDITEKQCPLYYVKHEDAWNKLKKDIGTALKELKG